MKSKTLSVGIVGLGIGKHHLRGYLTHPGARVVALCDLNEDLLRQVADENRIEGRYTDFDKMLETEGLDVVSVCTPNVLHMPQTLKALAAGCHVLVEKPMAMNAEEGRKMVEAAEKAGKRLMINFSYRFNKDSYSLKAQVDRKILGDVYFARTVWHRRRGVPKLGGWFSTKAQSGGGPLIDLGVHRLDLALWLMGYPEPDWAVGGVYDTLMKQIVKKTKKHSSVEDMAVGMVHFKNGAMLEIEASWASNRSEAEYMRTRLYGTKGGMVHHNLNGTYEFTSEIIVEEPGGIFTKKICQPEIEVPTAMKYFLDCILSGKPHMAHGGEGLKVMKILDAIYRSGNTGKPVMIE